MKAVFYHGPRDLRLEERPRPTLRSDEVLIQVAYTGICGSELHLFQRGQMIDPIPLPWALGHELSGIVAEIGCDVTTCAPGDRVCYVPWAACGNCAHCRRGLVNHCTRKRRLGGAFAEFTLAPQGAVHLLPEEVPLRRAALAEPLSCCVWAMDLAGLKSGETALIVGAGPIGLMLLLLAQAGGAARTIVSEPSPVRRQLAQRLGATLVVDPAKEIVSEVAHRLTAGMGADVALEAVGHPNSVRDAIDAVRTAGTVVVVGVADPQATLAFSPFELYRRELTLRGSFTRRLSFDRTLQWLRKPLFDEIISHEVALEEILAGFELAGSAQCGKVLVVPNGVPRP